MHAKFRFLMQDPRHYQIAVLASLLAYALIWLDFEIAIQSAAAIVGTALLAQYICTRAWKLGSLDPRSALISGLSLCILLRTNSLKLAAATAVVAILSKFVFRLNRKHVFNPTNFGIVSMLLLTDQVWVSPGQWGNAAFFAFLLVCLGGLVVNRAARSDVTLAFIASTMAIPLHRLENGALLLFTFFMISDPKTTPNSRAGRILFAALVSFGAWYVQFQLFRTNGLLWSLAVSSIAVPMIDWLLPGTRYEWSRPAIGNIFSEGDISYEASDPYRMRDRGRGLVEPGAVRLLRFLRS